MTIWEDTDIAINMDPLQKQMLDDVFDAFTMLSNGGFVSLMHVDGGFTRYSAGAVELFGVPGGVHSQRRHGLERLPAPGGPEALHGRDDAAALRRRPDL